jgi:hypothetical protein
MEHPFEIGKHYRNRHGPYEVLAIDEPEMRVRYEDGREETRFIRTMALAWGMWQEMPDPPPKIVEKPKRKGRKKTSKRSKKARKRDKLVAEILADDSTVYEILTDGTIPPGQIDLYRLMIKNPDDYFSMDEIAKAVRSEQSVLRAFGNRIKGSSDERVESVRPYNRLFFESKQSGGKTRLRIRPRVREIFQTYPQFYDFLINDDRNWLPEEFGSEEWTDDKEVFERQMAFFGFEPRDEVEE